MASRPAEPTARSFVPDRFVAGVSGSRGRATFPRPNRIHEPRKPGSPARMVRKLVVLSAAAALFFACNKSSSHRPPLATEQADPPEVAVGERLFLETRFAQFFAANMVGGNVNAPLAAGDPTMDTVAKADGVAFTGPFAGQSMNCRQCHMVDELDGVSGGGLRTYGDFGRRTPIPARADGLTTTPRNSPPL